ncbi:MAG: patatin [Lysobacterales bacterium]|nr:MAG: patatin [Xanthomonadales bacterium]
MNLARMILAALLCLCYSSPVLPRTDDERPKIGLALSGGGARGGAHVGVLKALEELGVPVDFIAGTSMGAIIGGFYAAGYRADEIERLLNETDWNSALSDQPVRQDRSMRKKEMEADFLVPYRLGYNRGRFQTPLGAIEGQHLDQIFQRILLPVTDINDFDRLSIPFRAIATDLVTGEEVVLSRGSLADALRASMSVPGVFAPVHIGDRLLVDGGMANNLPVSVVRAMGADIVIAVDISTPLLKEEQLTSVLSVTEQLTGFLTRRTTEQQIASLGPGDILIVPELGDFSSADFAGAGGIVPLGRQAADAVADRLAALADPGRQSRSPAEDSQNFVVGYVDIRNDSVLNDELIRSRLAVKPGEKLDLAALERSLDRIYSLDVFESVTYDLGQNGQGERGVEVTAEARSWGPNYLQAGLELSNDFSGNSEFKLGLGYTRNALNSLGGELRVLGSMGREDELRFDFFQPVDYRARWFVNPELRWKRRNYSLWVEDLRFAEFEIAGWDTRLGLGRNFGSTGLVRLDYRYGRAEADLITGYLPFDYDDDIDVGNLQLSYQHDSLDSLYFATSGATHNLAFRYADDALGSSRDFAQAEASGALTATRGKNSLVLTYEAGYSLDDDAPLESWYQMGGFTRLSGLAPAQLSGRQSALLSLALFRRLNEVRLLPAYAGLTLEAGNVWNTSSDIALDDLRYSASLFLGAESPLGPLYFAVGHSDNGDSAVYFYVGNPFRPNPFD